MDGVLGVVRALLAVTFLTVTARLASAVACDPSGGDAASVAAARAAVDGACDCALAPNHGTYVRCAAGVLNGLPGGLRKECKGTVKKCYARSTCGKPGFITCCVTKGGSTTCKTQRDAATCTAKGDIPSAATSCCDACTPTTSTTATSTTTATTTTTTTLPPCGGNLFPSCNGSCPTGQQCFSDPQFGTCRCADPAHPPCSSITNNQCQIGTCPSGLGCGIPGPGVCDCG